MFCRASADATGDRECPCTEYFGGFILADVLFKVDGCAHQEQRSCRRNTRGSDNKEDVARSAVVDIESDRSGVGISSYQNPPLPSRAICVLAQCTPGESNSTKTLMHCNPRDV